MRAATCSSSLVWRAVLRSWQHGRNSPSAREAASAAGSGAASHPGQRRVGDASGSSEGESSHRLPPNLRIGLLTGGCSAAAAGVAYLSLQRQQALKYDLVPLKEEVFESSDNLFVFFLDQESELTGRRDDIKHIIQSVANEPELSRAMWYFNIRKEGDPPLPEGSGSGGASDDKPPMKVVMYKGQRKAVLHIGSDVPKDEIARFFSPVIETLPDTANGEGSAVARVSGNTFAKEVVSASTPKRPVLLQMYEDTCFLCFLMRPFVNSLADLFRENGMPVTIKRLNIEKNDFPVGCPVARGTPTFVLFRGQGMPPNKWDEFKPKEIVEKFSKDFPAFPDKVYAQMDELQGLVSRRFQLFTQLVMWTVELQKLEALLGPGGEKMQEGADGDFEVVVAEMMAKDMQRTDGIHENIGHLQGEVDEVEHDAVLMGAMLAEAVLQREKAEAALYS